MTTPFAPPPQEPADSEPPVVPAPQPVEPQLVEPLPVEPQLVEPLPVEPPPVQPPSVEPQLVEPLPVEPPPVEPPPVEPPVQQPVEPPPVEPPPVEPPPVEPPPVEPPTEPVSLLKPPPAEESPAPMTPADEEPAHLDPPPPDAEAETSAAPVPAGRGRVWLPLTAVGLAVVLLAGGTGWLAWQLRQQERADTAGTEAVAAARDAARLLFSYNHTTLQQDFDKGTAVTTGDFRAQYQRTTKDVVSPVAKQYKAVVVAEVVEAAVVDAQPSQVTALVFLNQATTSTRVQGQQVDQSRVRMRLVSRGGRWLVEEVKAL